MIDIFHIFLNVVLPVFLMAGAGAVLQKFRQVPAYSISQITLYIFAPALVFNSLANTTLSLDQLGKIALFVLALASVMYIISFGTARFLKLDREQSSGFLLTSIFMNSGNYGLPVALFAFGNEGLEFAIVFFVCQAALGGTLAVFIASSSHLDAKSALVTTLKMPLLHATVLGLIVNLGDIHMPHMIGEPVKILGEAAVPSMLMVLGIQMSNRFSLDDRPALIATLFIRLVVSAIAAFLITPVLGIEGILRQVLIVVSAMPAAVFTIILSSEFHARPSFVTNTVVVGTLISLPTLTVVISLVTSM